MSASWIRRAYPGTWRRRRAEPASSPARGDAASREGGYTLVELLIVVTVVPMIVGALAAGLLSVFSLQNGVSNRLSDTADAQVISANFVKDVQSAVEMSTSATTLCGSGTQLLGLQWVQSVSPLTFSYISYVEVSNGSTYDLVRNYCATGSGLTSATTIAYNLLAPCPQASPCQSPPTAYTGSTPLNFASGLGTVVGVTKVEFPITEPKSNFVYTLKATPAAGPSTSGTPNGPTTGPWCAFALPGTGAYASTLCFVDFSKLNIAQASSSGGTDYQVAVPGGYTLTFHIQIQGGAVVTHTFPTWPQAFLGNANNGTAFYSGVGCPFSDSPTYVSGGVTYGTTSCISPAIWQANNNGGVTTVYITNIAVTAPGGAAATGWDAVSADAETTDPNPETITWTSNLPLTVMSNDESVDSPSDPVGNACNYGAGLTTSNGGKTVECSGANGTYALKTGTPMVSAPQPTSMTVVMTGSGKEALSFGLLLP